MMFMIMFQVDDKSFSYKTKIVGNTSERPGNKGDANRPPLPTLNVEVTIPLKYLSHFWRSLDLPLINCEIEQTNNITSVNVVITTTKLYVPIVTLSINGNVKLLENIKQGYKRKLFWNKYRSEIITQPKKQ